MRKILKGGYQKWRDAYPCVIQGMRADLMSNCVCVCVRFEYGKVLKEDKNQQPAKKEVARLQVQVLMWKNGSKKKDG